MTQLDLFDTPPASENILAPNTVGAPPVGAAIIAFPQNRNIGRVRHVAAKLTDRQGRALDAYWRRSVNDLASMLARGGLSDQQIEHQILAFRDAVGIELGRLGSIDARQQPGGAA